MDSVLAAESWLAALQLVPRTPTEFCLVEFAVLGGARRALRDVAPAVQGARDAPGVGGADGGGGRRAASSARVPLRLVRGRRARCLRVSAGPLCLSLPDLLVVLEISCVVL